MSEFQKEQPVGTETPKNWFKLEIGDEALSESTGNKIKFLGGVWALEDNLGVLKFLFTVDDKTVDDKTVDGILFVNPPTLDEIDKDQLLVEISKREKILFDPKSIKTRYHDDDGNNEVLSLSLRFEAMQSIYLRSILGVVKKIMVLISPK